MKTFCAIICEYNPLHNGHIFQINAAREKSGADFILCIMSGNFVQRGEPAAFDKFFRAREAALAGADLVAELPAVYALSSAQGFAEGAFKVIKAFNDNNNSITSFCFGSEGGNLTELYKAAERPVFSAEFSESLGKGNSYAKAAASGAREPNDILAVEYLRAAKKYASNITPVAVKRRGAGYRETGGGEFMSATGIREILQSGGSLNGILEKAYAERLLAEYAAHAPDMNLFYNLLRCKVLERSAEGLAEIHGANEGLNHAVYNAVLKGAKDITELEGGIVSRRYTRSQIRRLLCRIVLGITRKDNDVLFDAEYTPLVRVLAVRKETKHSTLALLPPLSAVRTADFTAVEKNNAALARSNAIDALSSHMHALLTGYSPDMHFTAGVQSTPPSPF